MADHGAPSDAIVSSLSPQNRHRRRRSEQDSSSKSSLTDLGDDLMKEILQRLRTAKDAFLCSSVCKNWYGIIFDPNFISRFVTYHANRVARKNCSGNLGGFESSISLVMMVRNLDSRNEAIILPENPLSEFQTLDFTSVCEEIKWVWILSSCHDLLLCIASIEQGFTFFICNPVTMKGFCLSLPKWVEAFQNYVDTPFALVLEPYCSRDSQGGCILNAEFRYRMVRFELNEFHRTTYLPIEIYCSETGEFIEDSLFGEEFMERVRSNLVVYRGKVHWCNGWTILAYDPFRIRIDGIKEDNTEADAIGDRCFIIKRPFSVRDSYIYDDKNNIDDSSYKLEVCPGLLRFKLEVCRGLLRFIRLEFDVVTLDGVFLSVWDLEDYDRGKWSVERMFCLSSLVPDDHPLSKTLEESMYHDCCWVVASHPCDEDLVYLSLNGIVTFCNLERKELNAVAEFSNLRPPQFDSIGNPIVIPWWPTPISSLQQQNTQQ